MTTKNYPLEADTNAILVRLQGAKNLHPLIGVARELAEIRNQLAQLNDTVRALEMIAKLNDVFVPIALEMGLKDRLVETFSIDMRFPLPPECGLHALEYDAAGTAFRWTGARPITEFMLPLNRDKDLIITIHSPFSDAHTSVTNLTCGADLSAIPLSVTAGIVAGLLPAQAGKLGPTRLRLATAKLTCPKDSDPTSSDTRKLGIALTKISIAPV